MLFSVTSYVVNLIMNCNKIVHNNNNNNNNNVIIKIPFLFIYMLTRQFNDQLQREHKEPNK